MSLSHSPKIVTDGLGVIWRDLMMGLLLTWLLVALVKKKEAH